MKYSIIIPTFNEAAGITAHLTTLQVRRRFCEIIIADGGSQDDTRMLATPLVDKFLITAKGRARQMNAGAHQARGDILIFLHADTYLPDNALTLIEHGINQGASWGRFDIRLSGKAAMLTVIAAMMNWRSRLTGIATGDQALFVTRKAFIASGHFPDIPLMEDIEISKKLKRLDKPLCLKAKVLSSGRRWQKNGMFKTIFLMWWLRFRYFFGDRPEVLSQLYVQGNFW